MVGQGALLATRQDPRVTAVTLLARTPTGLTGGKVRELLCPDLLQLATLEDQLGRPDACLFCAGVSSVGMSEPDYRRTTYDLTLAAADVLIRLNPAMAFLYVSGSGTDSTGKSRQMWARVKGETENALLHKGFATVALFRPGFIQPMDGVRSKTGWYNTIYTILRPIAPLAQRLLPRYATDTTTLGRAMVAAVQPGAPTRVYESDDINTLGQA